MYLCKLRMIRTNNPTTCQRWDRAFHRNHIFIFATSLLFSDVFAPPPDRSQDRSKKREASVRRCKDLVEALVGVQLGLDDGISALPPGVQRWALKSPSERTVHRFDPLRTRPL